MLGWLSRLQGQRCRWPCDLLSPSLATTSSSLLFFAKKKKSFFCLDGKSKTSHRGGFCCLSFHPPLPRFSHGSMKGFVSWHGVLHGLARLWDKWQFVYKLCTICLCFVLFLSKICHNKTTTKIVICQILYKNKTKLRQFVDNLSFVLLLSWFCPKLDKWQIFLLFLLWQISDKNKTKLRQIVHNLSTICRQIVICLIV